MISKSLIVQLSHLIELKIKNQKINSINQKIKNNSINQKIKDNSIKLKIRNNSIKSFISH